jgi:hypothetical protein
MKLRSQCGSFTTKENTMKTRRGPPPIYFNQQSPADAFLIGLIPHIVTPLSSLKTKPTTRKKVPKKRKRGEKI